MVFRLLDNLRQFGLHPATFTTFYLIVYIVMLNIPALLRYSEIMLLVSPIVILWMIYTILKFGKNNKTELSGEEFGYADKKKTDLGIF